MCAEWMGSSQRMSWPARSPSWLCPLRSASAGLTPRERNPELSSRGLASMEKQAWSAAYPLLAALTRSGSTFSTWASRSSTTPSTGPQRGVLTEVRGGRWGRATRSCCRLWCRNISLSRVYTCWIYQMVVLGMRQRKARHVREHTSQTGHVTTRLEKIARHRLMTER